MKKISLLIVLFLLLVSVGCSKKSSTEPEPILPAYSGAWQSDHVCFWVSNDKTKLEADSNCDDAAFTAINLEAVYNSGVATSISLRYIDEIPINNGKFTITNYKPDPDGSTFNVTAAFNGSKATGTITELNRYGVTSTGSFEVTAYLSP